jgi:hypothetical protein
VAVFLFGVSLEDVQNPKAITNLLTRGVPL